MNEVRGIFGCFACSQQTVVNFDIREIIHEVSFEHGMSDYVDLEQATPTVSAHTCMLTGANNIPINPAQIRIRRASRESDNNQARRTPRSPARGPPTLAPRVRFSEPSSPSSNHVRRERRFPRNRVDRQDRSRS